ncbi:hypothetical protein Poli38472_010491 [Pythium oligandrum]|uniref:Uncharacterized protein n=1 Tax=Pythium oligandrum TaxID=41045 RepID=A0A8K1C393_PYTOL|nr:hypothetical protein Poli38472_010491 [Pythium oligandrum]|eukprot:TMW55609.1 hypothetical protein Poli38472_010491 [Pythium oligandrum]
MDVSPQEDEHSRDASGTDIERFDSAWRRFRRLQRRRRALYEQMDESSKKTDRLCILADDKPWNVFGKGDPMACRRWIYQITGLHFSLLHAACAGGDKSQVESILATRSGCALARDASGRIPLHHAVVSEHHHVIQVLLLQPDARLQLYSRDNRDMTPVDLVLEKMERLARKRLPGCVPARVTAVMRQRCPRYRHLWILGDQILELMGEGGRAYMELDQRVRGDAWDAIRGCDHDRLRLVLRHASRDPDDGWTTLSHVGKTLLHEACEQPAQDLQILHCLLSEAENISLDEVDQGGCTALHYTAMRGWLEGCALILNAAKERGLDMESLLVVQDARGRTPLRASLAFSLKSDSTGIIAKFLAQHCAAALYIADRDGRLPLHCAVIYGRHSLVEELLALGADASGNGTIPSPNHCNNGEFRLKAEWAPCAQRLLRKYCRRPPPASNNECLDQVNTLHQTPGSSRACERLRKVKAGEVDHYVGSAVPLETLWLLVQSKQKSLTAHSENVTTVHKEEIRSSVHVDNGDSEHDDQEDPQRYGCRRYGGICTECASVPGTESPVLKPLSTLSDALSPLQSAIRSCRLRPTEKDRVAVVECLLFGGATVTDAAFLEALHCFHRPQLIETLIAHSGRVVPSSIVKQWCLQPKSQEEIERLTPLLRCLIADMTSDEQFSLVPVLFRTGYLSALDELARAGLVDPEVVVPSIRKSLSERNRQYPRVGVAQLCFLMRRIKNATNPSEALGLAIKETMSLLLSTTSVKTTFSHEADKLCAEAIRVLMESQPVQELFSVALVSDLIGMSTRRRMWATARELLDFLVQRHPTASSLNILVSSTTHFLREDRICDLTGAVMRVLGTMTPNAPCPDSLIVLVAALYSNDAVPLELVQQCVRIRLETSSKVGLVYLLTTFRYAHWSFVEWFVRMERVQMALWVLGQLESDSTAQQTLWKSLAGCVIACKPKNTAQWLEDLFKRVNEGAAYQDAICWIVYHRIIPTDSVESLSLVLDAVAKYLASEGVSRTELLMRWLETSRLLHQVARWNALSVLTYCLDRFPSAEFWTRQATKRDEMDQCTPVELCRVLGHVRIADKLASYCEDTSSPQQSREEASDEKTTMNYGLLRAIVALHATKTDQPPTLHVPARRPSPLDASWYTAITLDSVSFLEAYRLHDNSFCTLGGTNAALLLDHLHCAIRAGAIHALKWLLSGPSASKLLGECPPSESSALLQAAAKQTSSLYAEMTLSLLDHGVSAGRLCGDGTDVTLLHRVACFKDSTVAIQIFTRLLASEESDVNVRDGFGFTPLAYACASGQLSIACFLMQQKGIRFEAEYEGQSVFYYVLYLLPSFAWRQIVRALLTQKCNHAFLHCTSPDCACKGFESDAATDVECSFCSHPKPLHLRIPYPPWFCDQYETYSDPKTRVKSLQDTEVDSDDEDAVRQHQQMLTAPPPDENELEGTYGRLYPPDLEQILRIRYHHILEIHQIELPECPREQTENETITELARPEGTPPTPSSEGFVPIQQSYLSHPPADEVKESATMEQPYDELYKGDPAVGKTNLLATFLASETNGAPSGDAKGFSSVRKPTIGVEFGTKIIQHPNGKRIKAQIWDTAGQERYRAITSSHYRRAAGALVVYDVSNPASFENAQGHWFKELKSQADPSSTLLSCIMLVGNKVDLESPDADGFVLAPAHEEAATKLKVLEKRTSAKTGKNVRDAFEQLLIAVYDQDKAKLHRMATMRTVSLEEPKTSTTRGKQCCNV